MDLGKIQAKLRQQLDRMIFLNNELQDIINSIQVEGEESKQKLGVRRDKIEVELIEVRNSFKK